MTRRREGDPDEMDASAVRRPSNGRPWWLQALAWIGLPAFLVLFLLGAIPGLPSPLLGNQAAVTRHEETTREMLRVLRAVCRGVWRGSDEMRGPCSRGGSGENAP
jgi:hypothetical protein